MSNKDTLVNILDTALPFPPKVVLGYSQLEPVFTSGDLARTCNIPRSSAKYYINKMVELRLIIKVPHKRLYQKYANADNFSSWLRDIIKFIIEPIENGEIEIPVNERD